MANRNELETPELGERDTMRREQNCSEESCRGVAVATLAAKDLCLEHFLSRCYEQLSRLDPRNGGGPVSGSNATQLRAFVEECSCSALDVSLRCQNLNNLQRARLLDILLWTGDLSACCEHRSLVVGGDCFPNG